MIALFFLSEAFAQSADLAAEAARLNANCTMNAMLYEGLTGAERYELSQACLVGGEASRAAWEKTLRAHTSPSLQTIVIDRPPTNAPPRSSSIEITVDGRPIREPEEVYVEGKWMMPILEGWYGPHWGGFYGYLCDYNKRYGGIGNCDQVQAGQKILLPTPWVLKCMVLESLGYPCLLPEDPVWDAAVATLPEPVQACVDLLTLKMSYKEGPERVRWVALTTAKGISTTYDVNAPAYTAACQAIADDPTRMPFNVPTMDHALIGPNRTFELWNYWGPEDN
jgi:hypothetical protein